MSEEKESFLGPEFEAIKKEYRSEIPEKLRELESRIEAVKKEATQETLAALQFVVHKLAGNAGSFGYMEVSDECKKLDLEIRQNMKWLIELPMRFEKIKGGFHE